MSETIFKKLAKHLDDLPGGFPSTPSGVELRILKRLFTADEAELALLLTVIPEEPAVIAKRSGKGVGETGEMLDVMARKGLIFSMDKEGFTPKYMAAQFVVGIWEYHVNDLDEGLIRDMNEYIPHLMDPEVWKKAPQLRTVPIGKSIQAHQGALPYEKAAELVRGRKRYLVAPCICRREHKMIGEGCDRPEEACLVFDWAVDYYEKNGLGRVIDEAEALEILDHADKTGLVVQPSNSRKAVNICLCCGCCCQVLINIKKLPKPAEYVSSAYVAVLAAEECVGCGECIDRCQMDALTPEGDKVALDPDRCIGCGLCVTTCPTDALGLERKALTPDVPRDFKSAMLKLAKTRGKLGTKTLAATALKSKFDRLLAQKNK